MKFPDYAILALVAAVIVLAVLRMRKRKKSAARCGCSGCEGCPVRGNCAENRKSNKRSCRPPEQTGGSFLRSHIDKRRYEMYALHIDIIRFEANESTMNYQEQAKVMKAFCDENRLRILEQLRSGEKCACKLLEHLVIGQSALSYHMRILVVSGVVRSRECGKWTHYSLSESGCATAEQMLRAFVTPADGQETDGVCCERAAAQG
jgi:ArsR family transcriptional regulator, arsenate/arsenite/antimonite-responsive transcriptional repressor